ncbi:MAG TPA: outer membrane lipoprotein carrier protein LolA [Verrucomicrobiota bacterium]|nr:outer membrane lipoprotein carrier protein LolA [Verrucomicrobiota bacterium]
MAQAQLKSWSAEFVQTRHLQTLTRPLTASGRVWFAAPDQFRWELGSPPQSVAMRSGDELWMLSPPLKRAERYILAAARRGPMKDSLALLDTGFPRDPTDFRKRFELLTFSNTNAVYEFRLRPRDLGTRRVLPELTLVVTTNLLELAASDLTFADGSRLRNDFTNALRNPTVEPAVFAPALDATWKITNPGTGQ